MPENKDFAFRIEILDECLRNSYRNWTLKDLIDKVNDRLSERYNKSISKRTIQDDLKVMADDKNAPIQKRKNGTETYYYYTDPGFSIKNLPIKEEEIKFLRDAINILRQVNDFKILQDVDEIVNKLENTVKTNIEGGPTVIQFETHTTSQGTEHIDDIFTAIKEKVVLRILYQSFKNDSPQEYLFSAYLLKEYRNRWFVIGRTRKSDSTTILALDRVKHIKNSSEQYEENDLFNPDTYYNHVIGVTFPVGETPQEIVIKVNANQAPYIRTKPIHHSQEIISQNPNGDIIIKLWLINNYELRSVLLSYGADIEVLKPDALREKLKDMLQKASSNYI